MHSLYFLSIDNSLSIPREEMMFDQHLTDALLDHHRVRGLATDGQLPVGVEVEGELGQQPQLALDQDPARRGHEAQGVVPGLQ